MSYSLYIMISIPEAKSENVFTSPIILGVFDSKESAKNAWKQKTAEFKDIKSKTVHAYYETFSTEKITLPNSVYLWAAYTVYGFSKEEVPNFHFEPFANGFFETYEDYQIQNEWLKQQNPLPWRKICEESDFIFYASNENIIEKFEINRLVRVPVNFTDMNRVDNI